MWCSEMTTVTCPTEIPTRGNREGLGGSPRSLWQIKIKIKLLVWSVFSHLCQDKRSSSSSPCVKVGWGTERAAQPSSNIPARTAQRARGHWHRGQGSPCVPWSETPPVNCKPALEHGDKVSGASEMKDSELWAVWGVQRSPAGSMAVCAPCSLLTPAHTRTTTPQRDLGWMRAPGAKFLFLFYFLRIQLSEAFWLAQALLSSKQMQFFTKKDNSQVEFPLLSFSIRREN